MIIDNLETSFRENVNNLADLMMAEPLSPLQKATWLVEYVAKTKGAEHLKLPSRKFNLLQYTGADILSFVAIVLGLGTWAVLIAVRKVSHFVNCWSNKTTPSDVQQLTDKKRQ